MPGSLREMGDPTARVYSCGPARYVPIPTGVSARRMGAVGGSVLGDCGCTVYRSGPDSGRQIQGSRFDRARPVSASPHICA